MSNERWLGGSPLELLSAFQVARILGIGESTVYQLTRDGLLGYVRVTPSRKKFTAQLVLEFIESQTVRRDL